MAIYFRSALFTLMLVAGAFASPFIARADCGMPEASIHQVYYAKIEHTMPATLANVLSPTEPRYTAGPRTQALNHYGDIFACPEYQTAARQQLVVHDAILHSYKSALLVQGYAPVEDAIRRNQPNFNSACLAVTRAQARLDIQQAWNALVQDEQVTFFRSFDARPFLAHDPLLPHVRVLLRQEARTYGMTLPKSESPQQASSATQHYLDALSSARAHLPDDVPLYKCTFAVE